MIDLEAASRFLASRFGAGVTDLAPLGAGDWSRAFSFRLGGRELVARFGRHREDFEKDRQAMAFRRPDLPVPELLEIGEIPDGFYAVSERHFGTFLEAMDARAWRHALPVLLRALDALRAVEPPGRGVEWSTTEEVPPVTWREWLLASLEDRPGERVSGWRARLAEVRELEALFTAGERALQSLLPACPELRCLVHRDLLNRNVLVADDGSRLEAVFDWGCSVAGDFLYEVAWLTYWAPWYPALAELGFRERVREHYAAIPLDVPHFDERLTAYELQIGLEHIAYCTFSGREADRRDVARRTAEVLRRVTG
ncbi:MAG: phosphotransferase family protein [Armatimonadota bacterium]